jgi:hypothetical protein
MVSWNYLLGLALITILLISASGVARITGMSHQCLATYDDRYVKYVKCIFDFIII